MRDKHVVTKKPPLLASHEQIERGVVKILELIDERIQKHRESNDNPDADPLLRGNIAELKAIKKLILAKAD